MSPVRLATGRSTYGSKGSNAVVGRHTQPVKGVGCVCQGNCLRRHRNGYVSVFYLRLLTPTFRSVCSVSWCVWVGEKLGCVPYVVIVHGFLTSMLGQLLSLSTWLCTLAVFPVCRVAPAMTSLDRPLTCRQYG